MFVYRIEHRETGLGPYRFEDAHRVIAKMSEEHGNQRTHPAWCFDFPSEYGMIVSQNWLSGFACLEDLYHWFAGYVKELFGLSFHIQTYEVENENVLYGKSGMQLVFKNPKT